MSPVSVHLPQADIMISLNPTTLEDLTDAGVVGPDDLYALNVYNEAVAGLTETLDQDQSSALLRLFVRVVMHCLADDGESYFAFTSAVREERTWWTDLDLAFHACVPPVLSWGTLVKES